MSMIAVLCLLGLIVSLVTGQPMVYLTLGSTNITTNNTKILVTDIGEDADGGLPSLNCNTDHPRCCRNDNNNNMGSLGGEWYYPDGSVVPAGYGASQTEPFVRRRDAPQVARLVRRESLKPLSPTGSYCCVIPTTGGEMTFCANLVVCPSLTLTNGIISYSDPTLGVDSVATHICDSGHALDGRNTRICGSGGEWSGIGPACTSVECGLPPGVANAAHTTPSRTTYGGTVTYICNAGYETPDRAMTVTATCQRNGAWEPLPSCQAISCPSLPSIPNGSPGTPSSLEFEGTLQYTCDSGYEISPGVNMATATCRFDRSWRPLPTCTGVSCGSPPSIDNGSRTFSGTQYQDTATYSCNTGYQLSGSATVTCQADKTWTMPPTCIATCPGLTLANGMISYSPNTTPRLEGSVATHSCDTGYELSGGTTRACQSDRTWSGGSITCQAVSCGSPPSISNGSPGTPTSTTFGGTVNYSCDPGYNLTGCAVAECLSNGSWSCEPFCADNQLIQFQFGPTRHCVEWTEKKVELMYFVMYSSIQKAIQRSGHVIPKENIQKGYFSCYRSTTETTYRTTITGTERVSAVDYAALIQQWVDSGVTTMRVLWYVIKFDKTCPVAISSMEDEECE